MTTSDPDLRAHWTLDPSVTHLNHGSFGACPKAVQDAQQTWRELMERNPVDFFQRRLEPALDAARAALAPLLGAEAGELVFVPNATTAVNAVLRSFPFEDGDEILVTDHGYNACTNAARVVGELTGVQVRSVALPFPVASVEDFVTPLLEAAAERCPRLVLIDHITSPTGLRLPVETIVPQLHELGCEVLLDGAHAPGQVPLDFAAVGAAFTTGNAHKWLCAPKGAAYLHVRADWHDSVWPQVVSHALNTRRRDRPAWLQAFDWTGTDDFTPWLTIPAAIECLEGLLPGGLAALRDRNHALALAGRDLVCEALGVERPAPDELLGSMAAIPLPDAAEDPEPRGALQLGAFQQQLFERARIEVPVSSWPGPRSRLLRLSAQAYNVIEDYERLAAELAAMLAEE